VPAQGLTAVVCTAGEAITLADRLGRYCDSGVTYADQPLAALGLDQVRERILVTPVDAHLFAGRLRRELDPAGILADRDDRLWDAVDAAAARDIVEALPDQFELQMAPGGQDFSGGQQQRLRLARAFMADPDVLILLDPTSAVDAHTESKMAAGIARLRRGRATVVFTTSLLLLSQADRVVLVLDGSVAAAGNHPALMQDVRYRALVERGLALA
jgi:ABC-type multidrug transport system fused ATPase/permease subunit